MKLFSEVIGELVDFGVRPELVQYGNEQLGSDLAMPCFALSKELGKAPQDIAEDIASRIDHEGIVRAEAVSGFLNLWLKSSYVLACLKQAGLEAADYGSGESNGKTVVIDYVAQNLAKPLSIGHLRNALQGRSLALLHRYMGWNVITDSHVGDWGTVFGIWVVGFLRHSSDEELQKGGNKELGRVYVEFRKELKAEEEAGGSELKDLVQEWLLKLESGDEEAWEYHRKFSEISITDGDRILSRLNISMDHTLGESFYYEATRDLIPQLLESGQAIREADGSIIVPLEAGGVKTPGLIQKSNGALLYFSSDIATIMYREETWQPDLVIYVVGPEQQFHFKQVFAAGRLLGIARAELVHHWYGLVEETGEDGGRKKMSSRTGAVSLEGVLDDALEKAAEIAKPDMSESDIEAVAMGAVSFREFIQTSRMNVLFDWDEMFSLAGMSGPYVQYAAVRLESILRKAGAGEWQPHLDYGFEAEHGLLMKLAAWPDIVHQATEDREVSKVAYHIYGLARELNRYYEETLVLDDNPGVRDSRLWLMGVIQSHFASSLGLLGMSIPEKM